MDSPPPAASCVTLGSRPLPLAIAPLAEMALDLRWTWSHGTDALWRSVDAVLWERTRNPWFILANVSERRLEALARDGDFTREVQRLEAERQEYLGARTWYESDGARLRGASVAYFSMEFGLGDAIPLYAGGLGILAGDYLKAASDLGVPVVGIGILFQQGYFRQEVDAAGVQRDVYPYNDPSTMPVQPARTPDGSWLRIPIELPGRPLWLRVWRAQVGRTALFLLDGNDPMNSATDRGITDRLYEWNTETRLFQEMILGIGGWRIVEALGLQDGIAHLNEGHAAFAVVERARQFMNKHRASFGEALWATRGGNIFTTHTPVAAGFDRYSTDLIDKYRGFLELYASRLGVPLDDLLAMGRRDPGDAHEPVNLGFLAARGCALVNAVSRRHAEVSRQIFSDLFPRWPQSEVPITHVTNGVHVPSWDSAAADDLWTRLCGEQRWRGDGADVCEHIHAADDMALWHVRNTNRSELVAFARRRLERQLLRRGIASTAWHAVDRVLDPAALTLGFARRFAAYKRPDLLLRDTDRLARLLTDATRPVQIVVAGKAHPADHLGKSMIAQWVRFASRPDLQHRVVFLEDYDITIAEQLVRGVDVWINTPRPPWEASGTSGMKVLVNGGLNLSEYDGWWVEGYAPEVGWVIGGPGEEVSDDQDAERLYATLERQIVPEFYDRDAAGMPRRWLARVRESMSRLTPAFSANRMARDYLETLYLPAMASLRERTADDAAVARELAAWERNLKSRWSQVRFRRVSTTQMAGGWRFVVQVDLAGIPPDAVVVELYADPGPGEGMLRHVMQQVGRADARIAVFVGFAKTQRDADQITPRLRPHHPAACLPAELPLVHWQR